MHGSFLARINRRGCRFLGWTKFVCAPGLRGRVRCLQIETESKTPRLKYSSYFVSHFYYCLILYETWRSFYLNYHSKLLTKIMASWRHKMRLNFIILILCFFIFFFYIHIYKILTLNLNIFFKPFRSNWIVFIFHFEWNENHLASYLSTKYISFDTDIKLEIRFEYSAQFRIVITKKFSFIRIHIYMRIKSFLPIKYYCLLKYLLYGYTYIQIYIYDVFSYN